MRQGTALRIVKFGCWRPGERDPGKSSIGGSGGGRKTEVCRARKRKAARGWRGSARLTHPGGRSTEKGGEAAPQMAPAPFDPGLPFPKVSRERRETV